MRNYCRLVAQPNSAVVVASRQNFAVKENSVVGHRTSSLSVGGTVAVVEALTVAVAAEGSLSVGADLDESE